MDVISVMVKHLKWQEDDGIDGWRLDVPNCLQNQTFGKNGDAL